MPPPIKPADRPVEVRPRPLVARDLPVVASIEALSFPPDEAWGVEELRRRLGCLRVWGCAAEVPVARNALAFAGYVLMHIDGGEGRATILSLAVAPDWRRKLVGSAMVHWVAQALRRRQGGYDLRCEVGEYNLPAQLWLRALGFACVGVRRQGYCGHDGYEFSLRCEAVGEQGAA